MSQGSNWELDNKVDDVFRSVVMPAFQSMINDYDQVVGYEVKIVPDSPVIMGIEKYSTIMVKHPGGQEMIVCVYWVKNSERLIAENIQMVTLNKSFDIFSVTKEELESELKFLTGMRT